MDFTDMVIFLCDQENIPVHSTKIVKLVCQTNFCKGYDHLNSKLCAYAVQKMKKLLCIGNRKIYQKAHIISFFLEKPTKSGEGCTEIMLMLLCLLN
jgi:hypothetical protein